MKPLVTIILSVHNQQQYIAAAITSMLKQTYSPIELICIDDASADQTPQILKKFPKSKIQIITNSHHLGLAASLNVGLNQAKGKYIARMDPDDISHSNRIATQVKILEQNQQIAVCGTAATLIDYTGKKIGLKQYPTNPHTVIMRYNPIIHPTVMIRASIIKQLGRYDESLNGAEDYDLWLRIGSKYKMTNLSSALISYRLNPQGVSWKTLKHVERQAIKARWKAITKYHYSAKHVIYLLKPILSYLIPSQIKKYWFNII